MNRLIAVALVLCFAASSDAQVADRELAADVDGVVARLLAATGIPNAAIAVVKGDRPILVKGYGLADVERQIPATENTIYYIASTTKAFTALTVGLMAERGAVGLDGPVSRYLKNVQWGAGVNPDSITLRHLLTHTHGIDGNGPVSWRLAFSGEYTNPVLKELLQYHSSSGGRSYRYSNIGYNILGLMIDDVTRGKWQDAIGAYVTKPLGMTRTTAYVSRFDSSQLAMPYSLEPNGLKRLRYAKQDANMQSAGGLVSSAADMARWLEVQLNLGKLDGRQVFPRHVVAESQKLQATTSEQHGESLLQVGSGFGWNIDTLNGDTVLMHGGGFSSFRALIGFSPKHQVGVAVLTTEGVVGGGMNNLIVQYVLERAAHPEAANQRLAQRLAEVPQLMEKLRSGIAADRARRAARPQNLSKPLAAYTGTFFNAQGGTMVWSIRDGKLVIQHGALQSDVEVFDNQKDRLRAELEPGQGEVFNFSFEGDRAVSVTYNNREYRRR